MNKLFNDKKVFFIADIAANHDGSLSRAKKLIKLAAKAASKPKTTNKKVATKLCKAFRAISPKVLSANLQPTEAPRISKQ